MPKFYFTIVNKDVLEDTEGTELPGLEAAREHAKTVASELMHHRDGMLHQAWDQWTMIVKDDKGNELFSFPSPKRSRVPGNERPAGSRYWRCKAHISAVTKA